MGEKSRSMSLERVERGHRGSDPWWWRGSVVVGIVFSFVLLLVCSAHNAPLQGEYRVRSGQGTVQQQLANNASNSSAEESHGASSIGTVRESMPESGNHSTLHGDLTSPSRCSLGLSPGSIACCGHRGARAVAPENTLPAFRAALDAGANCLEMDVHRTSDGELVVMHEKTMQDKFSDSSGQSTGGKRRLRSEGRKPNRTLQSAPLLSLFARKSQKTPSRRDSQTEAGESLSSGSSQDFSERRELYEDHVLVEDMTLAEIKQLDAGGWFGAKFSRTQVSTLAEVLKFLWEEEILLMVELKAEARCDTSRAGTLDEDDPYWDIAASSKAIDKGPSPVRCSSRQYEEGFVNSVLELLLSLKGPGGSQARFQLLLASFNHRLIDQLTLELDKLPPADGATLITGTAYILHPQETYDGQDFLREVKWLAPHWSRTEPIMNSEATSTGRQFIVWVTDDLAELTYQVDLGATGVITNNPSLCKDLCT